MIGSFPSFHNIRAEQDQAKLEGWAGMTTRHGVNPAEIKSKCPLCGVCNIIYWTNLLRIKCLLIHVRAGQLDFIYFIWIIMPV